MKKPKTLKGFMSVMLLLADTVPSDLKGSEKLSDTNILILSELIGAIQNRLGDDCEYILKSVDLKWDG